MITCTAPALTLVLVMVLILALALALVSVLVLALVLVLVPALALALVPVAPCVWPSPTGADTISQVTPLPLLYHIPFPHRQMSSYDLRCIHTL